MNFLNLNTVRTLYKTLAILIVIYVLINGLLIEIPTDVEILDETIRNLFYHVPMWFGMMILFLASWILSIVYLTQKNPNPNYDIYAQEITKTGIVMAMAGLFTGMLWAYSTWGQPWDKNDPKLNGVAIGLSMYLAYWLLGKSIDDENKKARLLAVYNIFVFPLFIALILIMPKLADHSIHPGSGDTVNFKTYNKSNNMEMVFYPAVIGWTLLFVWIAELKIRIKKLEIKKQINELN